MQTAAAVFRIFGVTFMSIVFLLAIGLASNILPATAILGLLL